jgi:hypothetical protein
LDKVNEEARYSLPEISSDHFHRPPFRGRICCSFPKTKPSYLNYQHRPSIRISNKFSSSFDNWENIDGPASACIKKSFVLKIHDGKTTAIGVQYQYLLT